MSRYDDYCQHDTIVQYVGNEVGDVMVCLVVTLGSASDLMGAGVVPTGTIIARLLCNCFACRVWRDGTVCMPKDI